MKLKCELRCQKTVPVKPGAYFETIVLADTLPLSDGYGRDEYPDGAELSPGKQIAGFGRYATHALLSNDSRISLPVNHPWPDRPFTFLLRTNAILCPGILGQSLNIYLEAPGQLPAELPLSSPAVQLLWQERGQYCITVDANL